MRTLPLAAAAVASAAVLAATATPALAAGHGHAHAVKAHTHSAKSHDHLDRQERGASHVLGNQVRQVTQLLDFVSTSDNVNDADRAAVTGALQADLDALTAVQDQLATAATHHDLVSDIHQGILIRAVARTQVSVAVGADAVRDAAATATDATAASTATADADAAVTAVDGLAVDSTREQIQEARATAEAALADAESALGMTTDQDGTDDGGDAGTTTTVSPTP